MSFAVPTALFLSALVLPIIALYILKVRLRRVPVSTNLFWRQVYEEKPPRSLWQNLRHLLSLLAQLLLLLLLVLAIADPYFSWQALQARRLVVVLDTSASMKATDVSPSRFEAARTAIHGVLDGLRFRDEVAIVSAGGRPEVVLGMAGHVPTLRRAVDSIQPVDAGASLSAAIELAKQLIGDHSHGQVLVFSDGCAERPTEGETESLLPADVTAVLNSVTSENLPLNQQDQKAADQDTVATADVNTSSDASAASEASDNPAAEELANREPEVIYHTFANDAANVGITQFQARRSLIDPIGYEILVTVRNASSKPVKGRLELELDQIPVDVIPLRLKPDETWTRSIEKTSLDGGLLMASLTQLAPGTDDGDSEDGQSSASSSGESQAVQPASGRSEPVELNTLPTDDKAWAIVPPRIVQDVLIVTPGNLFLQKVFEANPLVNITVRNDLPAQWPSGSIIVLHQLIPEILPSGNVLVIDPQSDSDVWKLGDAIANPIITEQDDASPLMTHIRLDNVLMPESRSLQFSRPHNKLAATVTGETVYASVSSSGKECLVLSVSLERSDLAFRTAFPILITNALSWFAGQPGELEESLAAGQITQLESRSNASAQTDTESGSTIAGVGLPSVPSNLQEANSNREARADQVFMNGDQRVLRSPSGAESSLLSNQVGPLNEVGVWTVLSVDIQNSGSADQSQEEGRWIRRFAVNLADVAETDLRPVDDSTISEESRRTGSWFTRPIWFYLIVLACLFCTAEWFLYQRRFIS